MGGSANNGAEIFGAVFALAFFAIVIWFLVWLLGKVLSMLHRKGRSGFNVLWLLLGPIGFLVLLVIASEPDKTILDEIATLKARVGN